jgi:hypothetical protein
VLQASRSGQLYLDGWAGSGKSVALFSLVAWARANGYVALYLPSAFSLVQSERPPCCGWQQPQAGAPLAHRFLLGHQPITALSLHALALQLPSHRPAALPLTVAAPWS